MNVNEFEEQCAALARREIDSNLPKEEYLQELYKQQSEWNDNLAEMRRRLSDPNEVPDSEVAFHQSVLVKMQDAALSVDRDIDAVLKRED